MRRIPVFRKYLDLPLRIKFVLSFLGVILLGGILTLILGTRLEHATIFNLAQAKVRDDLDAARLVYGEKLNDIQDIIQFNSGREPILEALEAGNRDLLLRYLDRVRTTYQLDVLSVTDSRGIVFVRTSCPESVGDDKSRDPLVGHALGGRTVSATQLISRRELLKEDEALAERAVIPILPTPKAAPREKTSEDNGLMLKAAAPVFNAQGAVLGVIYGGILLNKSTNIVDRIKQLVFKGERYKGREVGNATIFLHDLRISTNVTRANGERAIGTQVSQEVRQAVLIEGRSWMQRAFVVNDWYITAYEPIRNINGDILGILYVGMLEKPYIDLRNRVMLTFTGMAGLCVVILLVILYFITATIIHPLKDMVTATNKIAEGDLKHRVNIDSRDEVGQLAHSFDQMTENLEKANHKLVQWGKTLERRVEERTQELSEAQDFLIQSEKMASLGKMAAGVAHEINNPLTSILINTHLMLEQLKKDERFYENLSLVAAETSRCSEIVKGLLEFSRQSPPRKIPTDLNLLLEKTVKLLENQAAFHNIRIIRRLTVGLPPTRVDEGQIKQVFWNLIINAAQAMPEGGELTITSRPSEHGDAIEILFQDTGHGIPAEQLNKLFDPFFTTKSSGTGLGLAVSYGILRQHKAEITVRSEPGKGSTFTVRFQIP